MNNWQTHRPSKNVDLGLDCAPLELSPPQQQVELSSGPVPLTSQMTTSTQQPPEEFFLHTPVNFKHPKNSCLISGTVPGPDGISLYSTNSSNRLV